MERNDDKTDIQKYPMPSSIEGTYKKHHEERSSHKKHPSEIKERNNLVVSDSNCNIHHTEMDDVQLGIKSEFEENNYFSLWS